MRALVRFLRFVLRVQGAVVLGAELDRAGDGVWIRVRRRRNAKPKCVTCARVMGGEIRWIAKAWRHLDILGVRTYLLGEVREGRCPIHGRRQERIPWAAPRAQHTHEFDRQVARLVQVADKTAVTRMYSVAWRTVGRIVARVVRRHLPKNRFAGVVAIGVDETSYKRRHRYLTVVSCLHSGRVLWAGEGKSAETLSAFFAEFGAKRCEQLQLVAMDMSEAYRNAVESHAPQADIVYDRFHLVQLLLKAIDEVRREECRQAKGRAAKALKKTRFSLLRNPRHWGSKDVERLERVERANRRLFRAWERRVSFEGLWDLDDPLEARHFLLRWTRSALLSRIEPLRTFAHTVREHIEGILGFFEHGRITNATQEGLNNKIKLLMHRAYGFRSVPALIAMIHLCCSGIDLE